MIKKLLTTLAIICGHYNFSNAQWAVQPALLPIFSVQDMHFVNLNTGFIVGTNQLPNGNAIIAKTTNGGSSWSIVYSLPPAATPSVLTFNHINFVNATVGFATGGYIDDFKGIICKTTNGGASWDTLSHNIDISRILHTYFFNANEGFCTADSLYKTTDGGTTWTSVSSPVGYYGLNQVHFPTPDTGYIIGHMSSLLIQTVDKGVSWNTISLPTSEDTEALHFVNNALGFIGCENGVILKTIDGGNTWIQATNNDPDKSTIMCLDFISPQIGFAGTFSGLILKTTDGGSTWNVNYDVTTSPFLPSAGVISLEFADANVGYAGTDLARLAKTSNAGGSSPTFISEFENDPNLLFYPNPATDFIKLNVISEKDNRRACLKSVNGKTIRTQYFSGNNNSMDIHDLAPGVYFLEVQDEEGTLMQKLVKM